MFKRHLFIAFFFAAFVSVVSLSVPKMVAQIDVANEALTQLELSDKALAQAEDIKSPEFMFDVGVITHPDIQEQNWIRRGINYFFERAIGIMAATIGSVAVLVMVVGGFRMLASAGRQEEYDKGKSMIIKAAIGLAVVLGAYILVTSVQLLIRSIYGT